MSDRFHRAIVACATVVCIAATCAYIAAYATPLAFLDDLTQVAWLDPNLLIDPRSLWWQHNEHRIPIPRALFLGLVRIFRDFRAPTWLDAAILAAVAAGSTLVARAIRGRSSWTDVFFPFLWLSFGAAENLLNGFQIPFVSFAAVLVVGHGVVATSRDLVAPRTLALVGVACATLPLLGAHGIAASVPVAAWLVLAGFHALRSGARRSRLAAVAAFGGATTALAIDVFAFVGLVIAPGRPSTVEEVSRTTYQTIAMSAGWLQTHESHAIRFVSAAVLVAAACVLVARARASSGTNERLRALGELAFLAVGPAVALAVGVGRGRDAVDAGLASRYATLAMSAPSFAYLAFARVEARRAARVTNTALTNTALARVTNTALVRVTNTALARVTNTALARATNTALALAAIALWIGNLRPGLEYGRARARQAEALLDDVRRRVPVARVAADHWRNFYYSESGFRTVLFELRKCGLPPYAGAAQSTDLDAMLETLRTAADALDSSGPAHRRLVDDKPALVVRAPAELCWQLTDGARRARGWYGVPTYSEKSLRRVRFQGVVRTDLGESVLFERILDPARAKADRTLQQLDVDLGAPGEGRRAFLIRIDAADGGTDAWGALSDVEIVIEGG